MFDACADCDTDILGELVRMGEVDDCVERDGSAE